MPSEIIGALVALLAAGAYGVGCWLWPYGPCPRCRGAGKHRAWWSQRAWRPCRKCKGSGQRLRTGRRAYNWWRTR
jgi:hypothetical protein